MRWGSTATSNRAVGAGSNDRRLGYPEEQDLFLIETAECDDKTGAFVVDKRGTARTARPDPIRVGACLSLTGRYARFGTQAAHALDVWAELDGQATVTVTDDRSDPGTLTERLPAVAAGSDVLLGPYSTGLTRVAGSLAAQHGWLLWNHGGAGDDVATAHPSHSSNLSNTAQFNRASHTVHSGRIVSILSPASRYAEPLVAQLAAGPARVPLWIAHGPGRFGRDVAAGAELAASRLGLQTARLDHAAGHPAGDEPWDLLCAGRFEEDVDLVGRARAAARPPRLIGAVAAGVREFGASGVDPAGVYGVGQWFPGLPAARDPEIGPAEGDFLAAYTARYRAVPDYPAVQAVAAAVLAAHCLRRAGPGGDRWQAALALDTSTLFGRFRIRPDGLQVAHRTVLVRWAGHRPALVRPV